MLTHTQLKLFRDWSLRFWSIFHTDQTSLFCLPSSPPSLSTSHPPKKCCKRPSVHHRPGSEGSGTFLPCCSIENFRSEAMLKLVQCCLSMLISLVPAGGMILV
jgi:hypothetical protein